MESSYDISGNVNLCNHYGKQYGGSSKNWKTELPYDSAIPLLATYLGENKNTNLKRYCTPIFIALVTIAKIWKQPTYHQQWIGKADVVHIFNGMLLSHKNLWNSAICSNLNAPREYYAQWNKSERERQILYTIIYMCNRKK